MTQTLRTFLPLWVGVALCMLAVGCGGPSTVTVTGRLTRGGQPYSAGPKGNFLMRLYPYPDVIEDKPYRSLAAAVNSDGTFVAQKVPPGKYLVTVQLLDPTPANDLLRGDFTKERSKIVVDVTGEGPLTIDLPAADGG